MRRLFVGCVGVLFTMAPVVAFAQGASGSKPAPPAQKAAAKKTLSAVGTVSAVAETSLTIKAKDGVLTFVVDKRTNVVGRGAGTKRTELNKSGKPAVITEFVSVGDTVDVNYHDMGATNHAATVRIMAKK